MNFRKNKDGDKRILNSQTNIDGDKRISKGQTSAVHLICTYMYSSVLQDVHADGLQLWNHKGTLECEHNIPRPGPLVSFVQVCFESQPASLE